MSLACQARKTILAISEPLAVRVVASRLPRSTAHARRVMQLWQTLIAGFTTKDSTRQLYGSSTLSNAQIPDDGPALSLHVCMATLLCPLAGPLRSKPMNELLSAAATARAIPLDIALSLASKTSVGQRLSS